MDKATRRLRQQIKANRTPRGELSPFEARGLGRKGKSSTVFPTTICEHTDGGKTVPVRKRRKKDNSLYTLMIEVGAIRCVKPATIRRGDGRRVCYEHNHKIEPKDAA